MAKHTIMTSRLFLATPSRESLPIPTETMRISIHRGDIIECRMSFTLPFELYRWIDEDRLFNLAPEIRGALYGGTLVPDSDIHIETILRPSLLPRLLQHARDEEQAAAYLIELGRQHAMSEALLPDNVVPITDHPRAAERWGIDPLLCTESWFCQSIEQHGEAGRVGYKTFWSYFSPAQLFDADASGEQLAGAIVDFVKDSLCASASETTRSALTEMTGHIGEFVSGIIDRLEDEDLGARSLFQVMVEFFEEDGWPFVTDGDEPVLCLSFRGDNGHWTCLAKAREAQRQVVFYSMCPIHAPAHRRQAAAEFLTRANHGLIIGNFEIDFEDGEIRCKTSIDVEGDRMSPALLEQIVYSNVLVMDEYLPGIRAVIEEGLSPEEAIARIESQSS